MSEPKLKSNFLFSFSLISFIHVSPREKVSKIQKRELVSFAKKKITLWDDRAGLAKFL